MLTSEEELQSNVVAELERDRQVDADRLFVDVDRAVVILSGTVETLDQKWAAGEAVKRVGGVAALVDHIELAADASGLQGDEYIARTLAEQLRAESSLPATIKVAVENRAIVLSGKVETPAERELAGALARRVAGARSVTNLLAVKDTVAARDVAFEIERTFRKNAELDANALRVECDGTVVTLSGSVHSWFERNQAAQAAWAIEGVTAVTNLIAIAAVPITDEA